MKVWKDIISGDEMVSDSYPMVTSFEDACLEVKSRLVSKNANDNFGIPGEDENTAEASTEGVTVIDIVDAHRLKEIDLDKKSWTGYIKEYVKKVKGKLEEAGQ